VEIGQYFDVVKLLGLADNMFLSTVLGRILPKQEILIILFSILTFTVGLG
jgi:hypothetical protein